MDADQNPGFEISMPEIPEIPDIAPPGMEEMEPEEEIPNYDMDFFERMGRSDKIETDMDQLRNKVIRESKLHKKHRQKFAAGLTRYTPSFLNPSNDRFTFSMQNRFERGNEEEEKFETFYADLTSGDLDKIKTAITLLNTEVCMSNESAKNAIQPDRFVRPLLTQLANDFDPSLMVQASNCLLTLIDLFPDISETIIDEKGLKTLEEKGKNFQYIDVAEDCIKLLDKIADNCPSEVWQTGCCSHFLGFIDFFDKSVQGFIMDLTRKGMEEFYSVSQWNEEFKQCFQIICNRCLNLNFQDGKMLIKHLECLNILFSRLNNCKLNSLNDDSEDENLFKRASKANFKLKKFIERRRMQEDEDESPEEQVLQIFSEMFEDQAIIVHFIDLLKNSPELTNSEGDTETTKKIQNLLFKNLNL